MEGAGVKRCPAYFANMEQMIQISAETRLTDKGLGYLRTEAVTIGVTGACEGEIEDV